MKFAIVDNEKREAYCDSTRYFPSQLLHFSFIFLPLTFGLRYSRSKIIKIFWYFPRLFVPL